MLARLRRLRPYLFELTALLVVLGYSRLLWCVLELLKETGEVQDHETPGNF